MSTRVLNFSRAHPDASDGYTAARFFYDMVAPSLDGVVEPPMPDGIELRPVTRDQYRTIWLAAAEAFRDHWGQEEWTDADWIRFEADPDNADPSLWRIGWVNTRRDVMIAIFSAFITVYWVMTIVGAAFRGQGQDLVVPWEVPRIDG